MSQGKTAQIDRIVLKKLKVLSTRLPCLALMLGFTPCSVEILGRLALFFWRETKQGWIWRRGEMEDTGRNAERETGKNVMYERRN